MQIPLSYAFMLAGLLAQAPAKGQSAFSVRKDSVVIRNMELVIRNQTKDVHGFLMGNGNGQTKFTLPGTAVQFAAGAAGFPAPGDSVYIRTAFQGSRILVWRNGRLQTEGASPGIAVDLQTGAITFRPALTAGDRLHIEALHQPEF